MDVVVCGGPPAAARDPVGLLRGGVARSLWLAPGAGITLAVFEWVNRSVSANHSNDGDQTW